MIKKHNVSKKIIGLLAVQSRSDIALARDDSSRFLPWIIALMVYLTALVLAGSFTLNSTINTAYSAQAESFSVNIPNIPLPDKEREISEKILAVVRETSGVEKGAIVSRQHIQDMIAPWLGKSESIASLPLPVIIEAKSLNGSIIDYTDMKKRIDSIMGGVTIDDHKQWISEFAGFITVIKMTLLAIALVILSATAFMVIFACKTSLRIHRSTVSLLHRLGAMDSYIAAQFQYYAARVTLKGSFVGSGFAAMTLLALHLTARHIHSPLFPSFNFSLYHWLILFFLPVITSLLAAFAARLSVIKTLRLVP